MHIKGYLFLKMRILEFCHQLNLDIHPRVLLGSIRVKGHCLNLTRDNVSKQNCKD